jgi:protein associated with RNAse G/E
MMVTVRLIKPAKDAIITYDGALLRRDDTCILLQARWTRPRTDLGYVVFEPGDTLYEYFYTDRWYNIYQLNAVDGTLKGWYCNITRPAIFGDDTIESEDLELDMFVSPDRTTILVLDEEEYAARGLEQSDPDAHRAAWAALVELQEMARRGTAPFCTEG